MTWIASLAIALLTGLVSLIAGGVVAQWCVGWYRISSFEGGSGYFVVFVPLPYRGALSDSKPGEFQPYQLSPGGRRLRDAVYDILVKELHGAPRDKEPATVDTPRVEIDGVMYGVTFSTSSNEVSVTTSKRDRTRWRAWPRTSTASLHRAVSTRCSYRTHPHPDIRGCVP